MNRKHSFDTVYDSQAVFRLMLEGISNPGRTIDISKYLNKITCDDKEHLTIAMTLLDNEVSFNACGNKELEDEIISFTLSKQESLDQADYIFVTDEDLAVASEVIENAKCGVLRDPHKSATLIFSIESLSGEPNTLIKGPGIYGIKSIYMDDYTDRILEIRDQMHYEYPTGIDLIFVTKEGQLMAIPRKVVREVLE